MRQLNVSSLKTLQLKITELTDKSNYLAHNFLLKLDNEDFQ